MNGLDDILSRRRKESRGKACPAPASCAAWRGRLFSGRVPCLAAAMLLLQTAVSFAGATGTLNRVSGWYPAGTNIVVTATAGAYSAFGTWSGDTNGCAIAGSQINAPINGARRITASFVLQKTSKGTATLWLNDYGLTNGTPDQAELLDSDGDGAFAWQEYIAGTDPTNGNDYFHVMMSSSNGMPVVWFNTVGTTSNYYGSQARFYSLQQLPSLLNTNWTTVPAYSNLLATGSWIACTNGSSTNTLFYRAKAWLE